MYHWSVIFIKKSSRWKCPLLSLLYQWLWWCHYTSTIS